MCSSKRAFLVIITSIFLLFNFTLQTFAQTQSLSVNATKNINLFTNKMLSVAEVNWEHAWGKPFLNNDPGLKEAYKEAHVGVIRYAGGLWANSVGWDRVPQRTPYTTWTKNGKTYYFHYGTNEIDNLSLFAKNVGADVMIQVNIATNDPSMWADMVRYTNIEHNYNFKYWEFGNELDFDTGAGITPDEYATRTRAYIDAMKAVDPTIQIAGGVPASAHDALRLGYSDAVTSLSQFLTKTASAVSPSGKKVDALSYHWYQACNSTSFNDLFLYQFNGVAYNSWRNQYSRIWSKIGPERVTNEITNQYPGMLQGITELNFDACNYDNTLNGNHLNALWMTDIIGRLAYYGLDYSTWYTGYGTQGYSLVYPNNGDSPTRIFVRPSYYAFLMYARYFSTQMVESTTYDPSKISIWASKDANDPTTLKLMVTNVTNAAITTPVSLSGFLPKDADIYTMKSTNPTDTSAGSNTDSATTTINNVKVDAMNVANSLSTIQPVKLAISGTTFNYTFPAYTTTALVIKSANNGTVTTTSTVATQKPGDSNGDGKVDGIDYIAWLTHYNQAVQNGQTSGDFDSNGNVDGVDYIIWLTHYGS